MSLPSRRFTYAGSAYPAQSGPRVVRAGAVMSAARRSARLIIATEEDAVLRRLLNRIEVAARSGRVLEWSHEANDLRPWAWPVHDRVPYAGAFVAASGLRSFIAERRLLYPVCLHGKKDPFLTVEEAQATIISEVENGTRTFRMVCAKHGTEEDCFYEVTLPRTPSAEWRNVVFNPAFRFDEAGRSSTGYEPDRVNEDERAHFAPRGLGMFNIEMPFMPPQAHNSAGLAETRALMALNSPFGLQLDYLAALQRLLQYCNHCDVVGLPAAMRDHIESGNCRRFLSQIDVDDSNGEHGGSAGSSGLSQAEKDSMAASGSSSSSSSRMSL